MHKSDYQKCITILKRELLLALGCTEPSAVAYAGALARYALGEEPTHLVVQCSGNIIKNVNSVSVPNAGGLKGIETAAALGAIGGDVNQELAVLTTVTDQQVERVKNLLREGFCECHHLESNSLLHIIIRAEGRTGYSEVEIRDKHVNVVKLEKNGHPIPSPIVNSAAEEEHTANDTSLSLAMIQQFADTVDLADVSDVIERQIECNSAIAKEGLDIEYGVETGRVLREKHGGNLSMMACACASAASDARMGGCTLPVVINSGSGNQGLTVSVPILTYAKEKRIERERLYRALVFANLLNIHQKSHIGSLSAFCGATSAACSAVCGIAYLEGANYEMFSRIITNSIATLGGMVCDGAKSSCAMKIAVALQTAFLAYEVAKKGNVYQPGEGLVGNDVEETISNVGQMAREGMYSTDQTILQIMMRHKPA